MSKILIKAIYTETTRRLFDSKFQNTIFHDELIPSSVTTTADEVMYNSAIRFIAPSLLKSILKFGNLLLETEFEVVIVDNIDGGIQVNPYFVKINNINESRFYRIQFYEYSMIVRYTETISHSDKRL